MANEEEEQELGRPSALGSEDARIYGLLPFHNKAKFKKFKDEDPPSSFSHNVIVVEGELHTPVEWEPGELPFLKSDIHDLLQKELVSMHGYWSVRFLNPTRAGGSETYGDRFRSVFTFRTVELMVRPLSEENNGGYEGPGYLKFSAIDAKDCLQAVIDKSGSSSQVAPRKGRGSAHDQIGCKDRPVRFEWKVDRAKRTEIDRQVILWRYEAAGGRAEYKRLEAEQKEKQAFDKYFQTNSGASSGSFPLSAYNPTSQAESSTALPIRQQLKRRSGAQIEADAQAEAEEASARYKIHTRGGSRQSGTSHHWQQAMQPPYLQAPGATFPPPGPSYPMPMPPYGPPQPAFPPPGQGFIPPQPGFSPPGPAILPQQPLYAEPEPLYGASQSAFAPAATGNALPCQTYGSTVPGQGPANTGSTYAGVSLPYQVEMAAPLRVQESIYGNNQPAPGYAQPSQPGLPMGWNTMLPNQAPPSWISNPPEGGLGVPDPGQPPPSWISNPQGGPGVPDPNQTGEYNPSNLPESDRILLRQRQPELLAWFDAQGGRSNPNPPDQNDPNTRRRHRHRRSGQGNR